jgi:hypothetical protein
MRLDADDPEIAAISAEALKEWPEPIALEEGGLNDEVVLASGVLFRFPII